MNISRPLPPPHIKQGVTLSELGKVNGGLIAFQKSSTPTRTRTHGYTAQKL